VSKYLADLTLDAIGEMFGSARAIMAWLADCARVVAASNAPVSWSSPLGLPIMQPYHKLSLTNIHTATQSFSVSGVLALSGVVLMSVLCFCTTSEWVVNVVLV
jgi:DNA-directed RNA polymerase